VLGLDEGSGAFLTLTPGSGMMGKKTGSGSGMNNPDHISKGLETNFLWVKIHINYLMRIRDPGWKNSDPGWKNLGPGWKNSARLFDQCSGVRDIFIGIRIRTKGLRIRILLRLFLDAYNK
jgi:hypothetical protein